MIKNNRYEDERVRLQRLKIGNEALSLLLIFLMVSTLYKQFVSDASFSEYAIEFLGFLGASVYILVRNMIAGNNVFTNLRNKALYIIPLICGLATAAASFFMNRDYHQSGENVWLSIVSIAISFVSSAVGAFIMIYAITKINEKRTKKLEEQYEE